MRKFCSEGERKSVFLEKISCCSLSLFFYSKYLFFLEENFPSLQQESAEKIPTRKHSTHNTFVARRTRKIIFSSLRLSSSLYPEDACSTSFNPRRRGWWMNDHDIVTIDQKQKLINKTEKYKNTRKENFFLLLPLLEKHYGMKKFLNSTTHQRRRAYSDVDEESALTCHRLCVGICKRKFSPERL